MKTAIFFIFLQTVQLIFCQKGTADKCSNSNLLKNTCWDCVQKPGCAWCSSETFTGQRCDSPENHKANCPSNYTVNPEAKSETTNIEFDDKNQISPKNVVLKVRVGEPHTFTIKVRPAKNYPVDLYYLMDLSRSMADDLENLKKLAGDISATLNKLTTKHRLAFGSYVDKTIMPYLKQENIGVPYSFNKGKETLVGDVPYDYKHILTFTADAGTFKDKIGSTTFSGNRDVPEGMLDALMQVAVCEKKLGWNPKETTRRIVLIATDAPFHIAGEGKFGGIVKRNDEACHLETSGDGLNYTFALEQDYPSVNQVFRHLRDAGIQPIFAASDKVALKPYEKLVQAWDKLGATSGKLGRKSEFITELIEKSYNKIASTVRFTGEDTPGVKVEIKPSCESATLQGDSCTNVKPGTTVSFDVSVTVDSCKNGNSTSFNLEAAGFGKVNVKVNIICECDCQSVKEENSPTCRGNGTLVCGACDCNKGWTGNECQCDLSKVGQKRGTTGCKKSNTSTTVCSGNGDCICGECQCKVIGNTNKRYYGKYCQCSDFNCELHEGNLCGGNEQGTCDCGKCICKEGYIGSNCGDPDCAREIPRCQEKGSKVNCSGNGKCDCGTCVCDPFYSGKLCKDCPSCAGKCDDFKTCVLCKVFDYSPQNETECDTCPEVVETATLQELEDVKTLAKICSYNDEDGCKYHFKYGSEGNASIITIYALTVKDCPEGPDVLMIVLAVIGGIVGIGILLLLLWKLFTAMVDRREYEKFEKDRAKSKWHREKNPLYQPATSTVQNPTFVGSRST